jgi:hypothetical protein
MHVIYNWPLNEHICIKILERLFVYQIKSICNKLSYCIEFQMHIHVVCIFQLLSLCVLACLIVLHVVLHLLQIKLFTWNSNMTSFFRFVNKRAIDQLGIISLAHTPMHVTDFLVVNVHVNELSSARIWQHKLCTTLSASVNINYHLPIKVYYCICTLRHIRIDINIWIKVMELRKLYVYKKKYTYLKILSICINYFFFFTFIFLDIFKIYT